MDILIPCWISHLCYIDHHSSCLFALHTLVATPTCYHEDSGHRHAYCLNKMIWGNLSMHKSLSVTANII